MGTNVPITNERNKISDIHLVSYFCLSEVGSDVKIVEKWC